MRIDIHAYIGGLQRSNTQRDCVTNCALRGLAHRNFSSQVLTIRVLYDAFEIVVSRIVTFLKSYRNCLVSLDLRSSFEIVTPGLKSRVYLRFLSAFTVESSRQYMANVELDSSDSGGSDFAGFDDEEIRRSIGETSRVFARAAVGVTVALAVSDSATDSSDATIVVITQTVITRI